MLSALVSAFVTSLSPAHRALGYPSETSDMRRRARTNRKAWQPHLDRTQAFIRSVAARCRTRKRAVVLGSGLLLDVPLEELATTFDQVVLKDVVCLPGVRRRIRSFPNASFFEHDVTGLAEQLHTSSRSGVRVLPPVPIPAPATDSDADLVVSLNILSQLWVVPRMFIARRFSHLEPEQVNGWCTRIVEGHYRMLRSFSCDVCMVADYEAVKRDRAGNIISRTTTVYGLELPMPEEQWNWNIAPLGRKSPHGSKELVIGAWHFPARS